MMSSRIARCFLVTLLGFSVSCSALKGRTCTAIGATSGVRFEFGTILADQSRAKAHACVESQCATLMVTRQAGMAGLTVGDPSVTSARPVRVQLQVADPSGRDIFDAITSVQLHKIQPNGPDCEPTAYVARVDATTEGQLKLIPIP